MLKELKMSIHRRVKLTAVIVSMVGVLLVSVSSSHAVEAKTTIITVPRGDVEALYAALYGENGAPRDNVEINLEAGVFILDPSKPFDGRLVLGDKSILRSTLKMAVDDNGVPELNENDEPIVLQEGAKIDGSGLIPAAFGEGIIMVGNKGLVEQLWVDGGFRPGVEITAKGTVSKVASTDHSIGFRVRAAGQKTQATLERNLAAGNGIYGIGVIAVDPDLDHPTGSDVDVQATLDRNASENNGTVNLFTHGGIGTDDSKVHVQAFHNVFRGGALLANVRSIGGFDYRAQGGANNNQMTLTLVDNLIANGEVGIRVEGGTLNTGFLSDPSIPLDDRKSSNNEVKVNISNTTFQNNVFDIVAYGALSLTGEPGGDNNKVKVVIQNDKAPELTIETHDCYPEGNFLSCTNVAIIHGPSER